MLAWERSRICPPRFMAECHKRRLNQGSFVILRCLLWVVFSLCIFTSTNLSIDAFTGTPPVTDWRCPPGRPRRTWLQQVEEDMGQPWTARCGDRYDPQPVKRSSEWVLSYTVLFVNISQVIGCEDRIASKILRKTCVGLGWTLTEWLISKLNWPCYQLWYSRYLRV